MATNTLSANDGPKAINDQFLPPGQTPLSELPQYGGRGGSDQAAQFYAARDFAQMFGRNPTSSELAQLAPSYLSSDPNVANLSGGKSQVAAYYNQLSNSPQSIYQQQQGQLTKQAPQYYDQVNQNFQSNLGRDATDAEKQHFGMLLASGQDPYQIQQALQQTPEYQNKQTSQFTDQLKGQLQSTNADYFSKYIMPSIQAQNAQAGRTQDSSGYQAQIANAGQQQNYDLQNYLAQVSASAYGNSTANASNQYNQLLNQQYGLSNANVSNTLSNQAANQQYNQGLNMYQLQQQAYNNYLNQYGKRNSGWTTAGNVVGLLGAVANPATAFGGMYQQSRGGGGGGISTGTASGLGGYGGTPSGLI